MNRVSVVIPAYNSATTLTAAITSALAQTHPPHEIIVVDDGSQDETAEVARQAGPLVKLIVQANGGPSRARNAGIRAAEGDYIQFLDADDQLMPEKIAASLALFTPGIVLAYCRIRHVAADGITPLDRPLSALLPHQNTFCEVLASNGSPIQTSTWLVRRTTLIEAGLFRDDDQRCAEDWDLLLRLAQTGEFAGVDAPLVHYRHTPGALTTRPVEMAQGRLRTVQHAGTYPALASCLSPAQYHALLAGRHHTLALALWAHGDRAGASQHLATAISLSAEGRRARRLYYALAGFAPVQIVHWLDALRRR